MSPSQDALTGLMSRATLHDLLERYISRRVPFGIILFDIDRFKLINYGFGDGCGDTVIQEVGQAVTQRLAREDSIARWSGQQFLCVLPSANADRCLALAEELRGMLEALIVPHAANHVHITASFGVAGFPQDGDLSRRLLASAEAALYQAKELGRNRVVHAGGLPQQVYGVGELLDKALREQRIVPAYQPIVDLKSGVIVAEEALARLITPEGDVLQADEFIDVAQKLQLTYKIDQAIISSTCVRFIEALKTHSQRTQFVNISGNLLRHPKIVRELLASMRDSCDACRHVQGVEKPLVIEVTEREFLGDIAQAREALQPFVDFGLSLALDDFGSGYSSFQYLAELPFSFLKIEGGLIRRVREPRVRIIVQGMHETAHALGLTTLAEGVESAEIAGILREIGINWAQGHYFHRPSLGTQYLHALEFAVANQGLPASPRHVRPKKFGA